MLQSVCCAADGRATRTLLNHAQSCHRCTFFAFQFFSVLTLSPFPTSRTLKTTHYNTQSNTLQHTATRCTIPSPPPSLALEAVTLSIHQSKFHLSRDVLKRSSCVPTSVFAYSIDVCIHVRICEFVCVCVCMRDMYMCIYVYISIHVYSHMHSYIYMHI